MKTTGIGPFFAALKAANLQPASELEYTSVFELLTAVLLSAQATDVGTQDWFGYTSAARCTAPRAPS